MDNRAERPTDRARENTLRGKEKSYKTKPKKTKRLEKGVSKGGRKGEQNKTREGGTKEKEILPWRFSLF